MYPVEAPTVGIQHEESTCRAFLDRSLLGSGTLYITENEVLWCTTDRMGLSLQYRDIAVHAISTDRQAFQEECLYIMYNRNLSETVEDSSEEDENPVSEIRFVPGDSNHLKDMFNAMSDCQCLHPDDDDSDYAPHEFEDGAAGEGFFTGEDGFHHLTSQGRATMQRLDEMLSRNEAGSGDNLATHLNGMQLNGENQNGDDEEHNGQFDDA